MADEQKRAAAVKELSWERTERTDAVKELRKKGNCRSCSGTEEERRRIEEEERCMRRLEETRMKR